MRMVAARMSRIQASPTQSITKLCTELKAQGRDIIMLNFGEPDFDTPDNISEAGIQAIRDHKTRYSTLDGIAELKAAIAAKLKRENGLHYGMEQITVSAGGKMILYNAMMAILNPGDEVLIPAPYWVSYPDIAKLAEGVPVFISSSQNNGFRIRPEDLEDAITPRTRLLVFNSPSNPSGAAYGEADVKAIAEVLRRHPHVLVMTDEIYEHLVYDGFKNFSMAAAHPEIYERTVTVNGMSKGYCMTGWRIGYAAAPREIIKAMNILQSQTVACANTMAQIASVEALNGPQTYMAKHNALFKERRDLAVDVLNKIPGLACHKPEGAFYVFPSCAGTIGKKTPSGKLINSDEDYVTALLEAEGVAAVHGSAFGMSPYFRISYALDVNVLREALDRIQRFTKSLH